MGLMPAIGATVGNEDAIRDVANYVRSLSGLKHDDAKAARGKEKFEAWIKGMDGVVLSVGD